MTFTSNFDAALSTLPDSPLVIRPELLSPNWMVFQIPSGTYPSIAHYVVGSVADGFRCSCLGWQHTGHCYHSLAVAKTMEQMQQHSSATKGDHMASRIKVTVRPGVRRGHWIVSSSLAPNRVFRASRSNDLLIGAKARAVSHARKFCRAQAKKGHLLELYIYRADDHTIQDRSTYPRSSDPRHRKG